MKTREGKKVTHVVTITIAPSPLARRTPYPRSHLFAPKEALRPCSSSVREEEERIKGVRQGGPIWRKHPHGYDFDPHLLHLCGFVVAFLLVGARGGGGFEFYEESEF